MTHFQLRLLEALGATALAALLITVVMLLYGCESMQAQWYCGDGDAERCSEYVAGRYMDDLDRMKRQEKLWLCD